MSIVEIDKSVSVVGEYVVHRHKGTSARFNIPIERINLNPV